MRNRLLFIFFFQSSVSFAQPFSFRGIVLDEKGSSISYATVALLEPADSTLAFYAVTNSTGNFEVKNITAGSYVLQISFLGYKTLYRNIKFPSVDDSGLKSYIMEPSPVTLPAAEVIGERIPLLIRGDTVEYNATSYKTSPDAVTEDLLKKLPGVAVDRNGNIKAQGEEVKKVTVDGKEFFGNDPKVATRNLPADAINKVQVFDTKSDEAELTGINDGKRDKTINLQLKDDRKSAWFGELQAGGGSDEHYQSNAKAYRFTPEKQVAFLGMLNNINKFGFSFSDYMDFSGGFRGGGESFSITGGGNSFPINFGQVEKGLITSGAAGLNYSTEKRRDNRFNISYLVNGINKELSQQNYSTNYTGSQIFYSDQNSNRSLRDRAHRINIGWKNRMDTLQTLSFSGQGALSNNNEKFSEILSNYSENTSTAEQVSNNSVEGDLFNTTVHTGYLKKLQSSWKLLSCAIDASWQHGLSRNEINTLTRFYTPATDFLINQYRRDKNDVLKYSGEIGLTKKIGNYFYLEGNLTAGRQDEIFSRQQGLFPESDGLIDSLSAELEKNYQWAEPRIEFKRIKEKSQFNISLGAHFFKLNNKIKSKQEYNFKKIYLLPVLTWEKEYKSSHRLRMMYETTVVTPSAKQFFPVTDYSDPLNLFSGNQELKPEVHNDLRLHWSIFDQFSFTSVFTGLRFSYIRDKISWKKTIDDNLVQHISLINVPEEYQAGFSAEYSTPVRKFGVNINLSVDEKWRRTITNINGRMNTNSALTHEFGISLDNRKKNKWEIASGITLRYERSLFTVSTVSEEGYIRADVFSDISYNPNDNLHFSVRADVSHYYGKAFVKNVSVPLVQAEASYSFLKHKRGALILTAFDILNRNTGVERISEYNYLLESKSDIIQRYVMLSFRYKLNKFSSGNNVDVKVNGH